MKKINKISISQNGHDTGNEHIDVMIKISDKNVQ